MSRAIIAVFALAPSLAAADPRIVVEGNTARQLLPATGNTEFATSRIIYLNKNTITLAPGVNDSRTQKSSLVPNQVTLQGWNPSAAVWADTVQCVQEIWAPFAVTVTDVDPGTAPHIEAVFGGQPSDVGMGSNVAGVSPFTADCAVIDNSIVFTFAPAIKNITAREACEIMSQEIAHSYGLDHELLASDPMTYLGYTGERAFQDQTVSCGEFSPRSCGISGIVCRPNQNSVQLLYQRVGKYGDDTDAPAITVNQPSDGDVVSPSFDIVATASDNRIVTSATIAIDGLTVATLPGAGPFELTTDPLTTGEHVIVVEASDGTNLGMVSRTVVVKGSNDSELSRMFGGCSVGGGDGGWLIGLAAFVLARRRR